MADRLKSILTDPTARTIKHAAIFVAETDLIASPSTRCEVKNPKFRYLIARNKITHLVDVIDTKTGDVVSAGHASHDAAETYAANLLLRANPPVSRPHRAQEE